MAKRGQGRSLVVLAVAIVAVVAGCSHGSDDRSDGSGTHGARTAATGATGAGTTGSGTTGAGTTGTGPRTTGPGGVAPRVDPRVTVRFTRRVATECFRLVEALNTVGPGFAAQAARYDEASAAMHAVPSPSTSDEQVIAFVDAQAAWLHAMAASGPAAAGRPPIAPPAASLCRSAGARAAARP